MKKKSVKLNDKLKNQILSFVNDIKNPKSRKRAYISSLGINGLEIILNNNNVDTDTYNCCSNNPLLLGEFDVADIKTGNVKIDVRVVVGDEYPQMWIPRQHLIYGFTPDIYVGVKINSNVNNAEIVNFIKAEDVNNSLGNKNYVLVDSSELQPASELINTLNSLNIKPKHFLSKDHDRAKELFLSYIDNEISNADKEYLVRHLAHCDECKNDFNSLYSLNKKFTQASNHNDIVEMFSEVSISPAPSVNINNDNNDNSLKDTLITGAAIASAAAAGAAIGAAGATAANAVNNVVVDKLADEISTGAGILGKIKGIFSKKEKINFPAPEMSETANDISNLAKEINDIDDEILSDINNNQDITENYPQETPNQEVFENYSVEQEKEDSIEELFKNNDSNKLNDDLEEEIKKLMEDSITEDIPEIKEETTQELHPELSECSSEIMEENSLLENTELDDLHNVHEEIAIKDETSLESLEGDIEDLHKAEEKPITPESSYFSNFVKPEPGENDFNFNDSQPSSLEEKFNAATISQEEIEALLNDIDTVEVVGNLETIGVESIQDKSSETPQENTVVQFNIVKREINPLKIAASVIIATSISLAGYAYWKYTYVLTDYKPDASLFKSQSPMNNELANAERQAPPVAQAPISEPVKEPQPIKPYVNKAVKPTPDHNNLNDDIARALVTQGGPVKITNLSWEISSSLASNSVFKNYLMVTGQALKSALSTDLTLVTDRATNNMVKVQVTLDTQGNILDSKIQISSGSSQVDDVVLQTLKNTLSYTKLPSIQTTKKQIKAGLIVNL